MRVLVTAASKYGATAEIAAAIAAGLRKQGIDAVEEPIDDASAEGFDAVVLGSAVYVGSWMKPAKEFLRRNMASLETMPVWLFSSGPIGDPPKPDDGPTVTDLVQTADVRGHKVFPGRLYRNRLSLAERAMVTALRAPEGDFRDWDAIRLWAVTVAAELNAGVHG